MRYFTIGCIAPILVLISINISLADIGIIVAFNSNLEQIKKSLKIKEISKKAGREFYSGKINNIDVVLVRSPMGKVNNAITAQALLSHYPVTSVVSIAPAGSIDKGLNIGDIIIATEVFQHDFGTIKPYGFIWSRVPDGTNRDEPGYNLADKRLRKLAILYANNKKKTKNRIIEGIIVTGDQFISAQNKKEWLFKKFKAMAVDMGAGAIAQVCYANRVSFCILRIITDKAKIGARINFEKSIPGYQSDIDILKFVKGILQREYYYIQY
ncbi:MAG: 5'-methylthioadenosine/adenosylhomocysteine nucleosidase [Desulfobacterales bacterium]|nr:5'-methylthioadenosine/adenosylhomocysteine nucleosidase [Desulfobacterales bacterium]